MPRVRPSRPSIRHLRAWQLKMTAPFGSSHCQRKYGSRRTGCALPQVHEAHPTSRNVRRWQSPEGEEDQRSRSPGNGVACGVVALRTDSGAAYHMFLLVAGCPKQVPKKGRRYGRMRESSASSSRSIEILSVAVILKSGRLGLYLLALRFRTSSTRTSLILLSTWRQFRVALSRLARGQPH